MGRWIVLGFLGSCFAIACSNGRLARHPASENPLWEHEVQDWKTFQDPLLHDTVGSTQQLLCLSGKTLRFRPDEYGFSAENAFFLALMSALAYENQKTGTAIAKLLMGFSEVDFYAAKQEGEGGTVLRQLLGDIMQSSISTKPKPVPVNDAKAKATNKKAVVDAQAFFLENDRFAVLALRGTGLLKDIKEFADLLTDADVRHTDLDPSGKIHTGFFQSTSLIYSSLIERIKKLPPGKPLWITGHSLGGGIATLFTGAMFQSRQQWAEDPKLVDGSVALKDLSVHGLYTYGMPKAGDSVFVKNLETIFSEDGPGVSRPFVSARVVNTFDPFPTLPRDFAAGNIRYSQSERSLKYISAQGELLTNQDAIEAAPKTIERLLELQKDALGSKLPKSFGELVRLLKKTDWLENHSIYNYAVRLGKVAGQSDLSPCLMLGN